MENHEEILVDLQGYGSGIGRWGSVGNGRPKASQRGSRRVNGLSRSNRRTSGENKKGRNPLVDKGDEDAAASEDSRSSSRRTENGEAEDGKEEEEDKAEGEEERGNVSGRKAPAQVATRVSIPRHRDVSVAPPRSALRRTRPAGGVEQGPEVPRFLTPVSVGPESPKTIKKEKPRFHFRNGVKAYINDLFEYKVDELVDQKVEKRLALRQSREPTRAPASGVSKRNVTFPEGVKPADLSSPKAKRPAPIKANSKRPVAKVPQPAGPKSSRVRSSSVYWARNRTPTPALYRVGNTRKGERSATPKSALPKVVVKEPLLGILAAEERGGTQEEWIDDVEEEETINGPAGSAGTYISEVAEVEDGAGAGPSSAPTHGVTNANRGVYPDIPDAARIGDFDPGPDAATFAALYAGIPDDITSDGESVDPLQLVRGLWPNLGPHRPDPAPRRPLIKRHGFVNTRRF